MRRCRPVPCRERSTLRRCGRCRFCRSVSARGWRLFACNEVAAFIDLRVVKPIVISADGATRDVGVVDAASSRIRVVTPRRRPADCCQSSTSCADQDVAAMVDGGAASNVPVELAWGGSATSGSAPQRVLSGVRLLPSALGPRRCGWYRSHPGGQLQMVRSLLRRPPRPIRASAVAGEPGAVRGGIDRACR